MAKNVKSRNVKSRSWTFLVYPDSAPEDWENTLMGLKYCYCLHDKDVNKDGQVKKAHIHVLLTFDGSVTYNTIKDITDSLNCPIPQSVKSLRGMIRYLIHADNKDKHHYDRKEIISVGMDAEIEQAFALKKTDDEKKEERVQLAYKLSTIIRDNCFLSWDQLMDYLQELNDSDLTDYACNHAYLTTQFLTSTWHKMNRK